MSSLATQRNAAAEHRLGVLLVAAAAVGWSVSGIFARLLTVDPWTAVCVRSMFGALYMAIGLAFVHRGRSLAAMAGIGVIGLVTALAGGIAMIAFVSAFYYTSVANVAVIYSTMPFFAAALGWLVLHEKPSKRTLIASAIALFGVGVMVSGSLGAGRLLGDMLAFIMAASFAIVAVIIRARPKLEMLPVNLLICVVAVVGTLPVARLDTVDLPNAIVLAAFAFTSIPLAFFLFLAGARRIPAAEAGLITTLEVVLSPLWVFLIFSENPGLPALIGGTIVVAAVLWRVAGELARGGERA